MATMTNSDVAMIFFMVFSFSRESRIPRSQ
jgi:hypothetical protein